jgi:tungstate transport system permease protein
MTYLIEGLKQAGILIVSLDPEIYEIVGLSLYCSLTATLIASVFGLPAGFFISHFQFRGKKSLITLFNTLMALPTVVVGLFCYSFLSRQGPLGFIGLLFTPWAIIIGEVILAFPIVTALSITAAEAINPKIRETSLTLGASPTQSLQAVFFEGKIGFAAAVIAGFGRVVAEVGAAMILGGNIKGFTRTIPTAIALETSKGEFAFGLALGIILLSMALSVNIIFHYLRGRKKV